VKLEADMGAQLAAAKAKIDRERMIWEQVTKDA